jgi:hypothetical protein
MLLAHVCTRSGDPLESKLVLRLADDIDLDKLGAAIDEKYFLEQGG